jgi:hypothetical protein
MPLTSRDLRTISAMSSARSAIIPAPAATIKTSVMVRSRESHGPFARLSMTATIGKVSTIPKTRGTHTGSTLIRSGKNVSRSATARTAKMTGQRVSMRSNGLCTSETRATREPLSHDYK